MTVEERINLIRLMESQSTNQKYFDSIGVEVYFSRSEKKDS